MMEGSGLKPGIMGLLNVPVLIAIALGSVLDRDALRERFFGLTKPQKTERKMEDGRGEWKEERYITGH